MSNLPTYRLTEQEWLRDKQHRDECGGPPCGDVAHMYARALGKGRVFVDGVPAEFRQLKEIIGDESFRRLTVAAAITNRDAIAAVQQAVEAYTTLLEQERVGFVIELVRDMEKRPFPLE